MSIYHGGNRGLKIGGAILPPAATGKRCTSDIIVNQVHRRDRVYVTPSFAAACMYASVHETPTVYEVEPEGSLEPDPDCNTPELSAACHRARIVAIHKVPGKVIKRCRKALTAS